MRSLERESTWINVENDKITFLDDGEHFGDLALREPFVLVQNDGAPLRFRNDDGKVIAYSVGPDGTDDNGRSVDGMQPDVAVEVLLDR